MNNIIQLEESIEILIKELIEYKQRIILLNECE